MMKRKQPRATTNQARRLEHAARRLEEIQKRIAPYIKRMEVVGYSTTGKWETPRDNETQLPLTRGAPSGGLEKPPRPVKRKAEKGDSQT